MKKTGVCIRILSQKSITVKSGWGFRTICILTTSGVVKVTGNLSIEKKKSDTISMTSAFPSLTFGNSDGLIDGITVDAKEGACYVFLSN